eukprot:333647-Pyramimonas_sp.AAC.1
MFLFISRRGRGGPKVYILHGRELSVDPPTRSCEVNEVIIAASQRTKAEMLSFPAAPRQGKISCRLRLVRGHRSSIGHIVASAVRLMSWSGWRQHHSHLSNLMTRELKEQERAYGGRR